MTSSTPPLILTGESYLSLPTGPDLWLLEPLLPTGGALLLYGDPKVGKSYAALQLSLAIAGGDSHWLSFTIRQRGPVVYVQLDTPRAAWKLRLETLSRYGEQIDRIHLTDKLLLDTHPFNVLNPEHFLRLKDQLARINPVAVVIDTLREAHRADENDATEMQEAIAALEALCAPAAMVLIQHPKKPGENGPNLINDPRGSSYVVGRMDAIVRFTPKAVYYTGRTCDSGHIPVERLANGFWAPRDGVDSRATLS